MAAYPGSARERAMKAQDVILRALSKQITFWQAAQILRISPRHLRRLNARYRFQGFDGLYDRRRGRPSPKRVPWAVLEQVLGLHRERYFDFSVRHFNEKQCEQHGLLGVLAFAGCQGPGKQQGTPRGSFPVSVTATSSAKPSVQASTTVILTVQ